MPSNKTVHNQQNKGRRGPDGDTDKILTLNNQSSTVLEGDIEKVFVCAK